MTSAKPSRRVLGAALGLLWLLAGCTAPARHACAPGAGAKDLLVTMYFGRSIKGHPDVTDLEWLGFLNDTVSPALPAGYTVMDATGAWRNPASGATIREATKVLVTALPDAPASLAEA